MKIAVSIAGVAVLLFCSHAFTQTTQPDWAEHLSACPASVHLHPESMEDVDWRQKGSFCRRPWPDEHNKTHHSELVVENLRCHHFIDKPAIQIKSGSPDKPRTAEGQIASYTKITFRNLDIGPGQRVTPGVHMDHIWIGGGHDPSILPDVLFEDIFLHDGNKGVMPILFEQGASWGTLTLRRVATANTAHPAMIKLGGTSFKDIIVEDCPNLRLSLQGIGQPVILHVRHCLGSTIKLEKDFRTNQPPNVTIVYDTAPATQPATRP